MHEPKIVTGTGPWGGATVEYRGARIECFKGDHVCGLYLDGHPLTGTTFGSVGTITPLVDRWLDQGELPPYIRAVPKAWGKHGRDGWQPAALSRRYGISVHGPK